MMKHIQKNFDMKQICESGQCFRMYMKDENTCFVTAGDRYLELTQEGSACSFFCTEDEFYGFWQNYFDLETDYSAYMEQVDNKDTYLTQACAFGSGIRILKQDLWEMIVTFLISQQNNIVRIRRCVQNICEKYGTRMELPDGGHYFAFPKPEALAVASEEELMACNLGYRSKYVHRTAETIRKGEVSLEAIGLMEYKKAREELLKLYGVGEKVADCICLFGLHHLQAFPVDTHIRQVLEKNYPNGFPMESYRGFEGVMQQYIFYHDLKK